MMQLAGLVCFLLLAVCARGQQEAQQQLHEAQQDKPPAQQQHPDQQLLHAPTQNTETSQHQAQGSLTLPNREDDVTTGDSAGSGHEPEGSTEALERLQNYVGVWEHAANAGANPASEPAGQDTPDLAHLSDPTFYEQRYQEWLEQQQTYEKTLAEHENQHNRQHNQAEKGLGHVEASQVASAQQSEDEQGSCTGASCSDTIPAAAEPHLTQIETLDATADTAPVAAGAASATDALAAALSSTAEADARGPRGQAPEGEAAAQREEQQGAAAGADGATGSRDAPTEGGVGAVAARSAADNGGTNVAAVPKLLASVESSGAMMAAPESPLGGLTVEKRVKAARELMFGSPAVRNLTAGLAALRELHALVEAALPSTPTFRARSTTAAAASPTGGGESAVGSQLAAQPPPTPQQRSLHVEVATSRLTGLYAAATATFHLAALAGAGVLPEDVVPYDPMGAVRGLHQAARAGSLEALMALADRHAQGIGTPASCPRALQFAKLAASYLVLDVEREQRYAPPLTPVSLRERFADSGYVVAEEVENGADVISLEEDMALRGNADAMRRMAYRRLVGRGLEADPEAAYHDFQAAAAQGDPYAIFNIGYMHLRGLFVPQNYTSAREYFERAAEKGLPSAHNGLGVLAWNGQGMPANLTAARESFERGAALNNSDSLFNLATMHYHGAGTPINQTLALELYKRAVEAGHWRAPYNLALALEMGVGGGPPNCTGAMSYLRTFLAERGTWGQQLTEALKLLDAGDATGALLAYLSVAEQGSSVAAANAAWLLRRRAGFSGPAADKLAAKYFQRAAKQGHTGSMVELGHMILATAPRTTTPTASAITTTAPSTTLPQDPSTTGTTATEAPAATVTTGDTTSAASTSSPNSTAPNAESADSNASTEPSAASRDPAKTSSSASSVPATAPAHPPPLVPPGPLPTTRAILGVSTAADAVAWYRAAAAAGDPEGLFYLGWAHYVGRGVQQNTTMARLHWLRSFEVAGIRSVRALAPLLALAGMRLDAWLEPLTGPQPLVALHELLRGGQVMGKAGGVGTLWRSVWGLAAGRDGGGGDAEAWGVMWARLGGEGSSGENALMVGLATALLVVVMVRRRRLAERTA